MMMYPIGAVSRLTGLSVEALRAWERRYSVVSPVRDERGRMYAEDDVRRLKLLRELTERGHAIGRLASLPESELVRLAQTASEPRLPEPAAIDVDGLFAQVRAYRTHAAERRLIDAALMLPPRDVVFRLVLPVLRRVGEDWCAGKMSIAEEHAVTGLIQGLLHAILRQQSDGNAPVRLIFAQLPGERHSLGLQCASVLAAAARFGVIHLGLETPVEEVVRAAKATQPLAVVLGPTHDASDEKAAREVKALDEALPDGVALWVGGEAREHLVASSRMVMLATLENFESELKRRGALDRLF